MDKIFYQFVSAQIMARDIKKYHEFKKEGVMYWPLNRRKMIFVHSMTYKLRLGNKMFDFQQDIWPNGHVKYISVFRFFSRKIQKLYLANFRSLCFLFKNWLNIAKKERTNFFKITILMIAVFHQHRFRKVFLKMIWFCFHFLAVI